MSDHKIWWIEEDSWCIRGGLQLCLKISGIGSIQGAVWSRFDYSFWWENIGIVMVDWRYCGIVVSKNDDELTGSKINPLEPIDVKLIMFTNPSRSCSPSPWIVFSGYYMIDESRLDWYWKGNNWRWSFTIVFDLKIESRGLLATLVNWSINPPPPSTFHNHNKPPPLPNSFNSS